MMEKYVDAMVHHFSVQPMVLATEYVWPRSKTKRVPFDLTFAKRQELSRIFLQETTQKSEIALEMVRDWGGIKIGSSEVRTMANETPNQLIERGFNRVASWSKVITLHDPEKYLIYDARVAFSINSILIEAGFSQGFFPMPPGRNTKIVNVLKKYSENGLKFGRSLTIAKNNFYRPYLDLVHSVAARMENTPAWHIEMALFARGPTLAEQVLSK